MNCLINITVHIFTLAIFSLVGIKGNELLSNHDNCHMNESYRSIESKYIDNVILQMKELVSMRFVEYSIFPKTLY